MRARKTGTGRSGCSIGPSRACRRRCEFDRRKSPTRVARPGGLRWCHSRLGQSHDRHPRTFNRLNDLDEAVEIYRLGDIIIGVEVVGLLQITVFSGCRQDNYGNAAKVGIALELSQYFVTAHAADLSIFDTCWGASVPQPLRLALYQLVAHWFEQPNPIAGIEQVDVAYAGHVAAYRGGQGIG